MAKAKRRAIGIVRVSQVNGREGDSFASPDEQRDRILAACERDGLELVTVHDELDVSGGTPLEQRAGLREAIEAVENGRADVIVAAYFDRLVRSLAVQGELVERVERAGGSVLALDIGEVTGASAGQWLSGTMLGAVSEYQRRTTAERSAEAQARAVTRGVLPWPNIPPGYTRGDDGVLVPDPATAPVVAEAFAMRAAGATVAAVRTFLRENGVERSYHGVGSLLASRVVLGQIHFGKLVNLAAHPAIVDADTWAAVQRVRVPRGRAPKSDRLLARLGVLRCGTCGGRMVVGMQKQNGRAYPFYRCPGKGSDCEGRVTIGATIAEGVVTTAARAALADEQGRASVEDSARAIEEALERAQDDLDAAIRAFVGVADEPAAAERLADLRRVRDEARSRVDQIGGQRVVVSISAAEDWDDLSLDGRRELIRAVVARAVVGPVVGRGRAAERVTVDIVGE